MTSKFKEVKTCEVCNAQTLRPVLDLGMHPLCDDLVPINEQRLCEEYPIEILYCSACQTAHQRFQIDKEFLFPATYHYRSGNTADVLEGMKQFVQTCEKSLSGIKSTKVLDIGCNDGSLLNFFKSHGATTFGIEPTDAYLDAEAAGHVVLKGYLTEGLAREFVAHHGCVDLVTFTNVFAHIDDLNGVIRSINILRHQGTAVAIENHYLGAILRRNQFDTFYHEHPRTYSYGSFLKIAETLGMVIHSVEFPSRYGGNIRVLLTPKIKTDGVDIPSASEIMEEELGFDDHFKELADAINVWRREKKQEILAAVKLYGPLLAKGFPGRAAIPIKMLGLDHNIIKAAYEKPTSQKIGHWIPGTRIPIVSDSSLLKDLTEGAPILNLAWHIEDEIKNYMEKKGFSGSYINII